MQTWDAQSSGTSDQTDRRRRTREALARNSPEIGRKPPALHAAIRSRTFEQDNGACCAREASRRQRADLPVRRPVSARRSAESAPERRARAQKPRKVRTAAQSLQTPTPVQFPHLLRRRATRPQANRAAAQPNPVIAMSKNQILFERAQTHHSRRREFAGPRVSLRRRHAALHRTRAGPFLLGRRRHSAISTTSAPGAR